MDRSFEDRSSGTRVTLSGVQVLRFVAAGGVAAFHAFEFAARDIAALPERLLDLTNLGAVGVHIFFVISGFIMMWTSRARFGRAGQAAPFLVRRAVRIFPVYWVIALFNLPLLIAYGLGGADTASAVLRALVLWPSDASGLIFVGWTLSYELYFYVLFAGVLALSARRALAVLSALMVGLVALGALGAPTGEAARLATNPLLLEFLAGAVIGLYFMEGGRLPKPLALIALGAGTAAILATAFVSGDLPLLIVWGGPSVLIVAGTVGLDVAGRFPSRLGRLTPLGDSSYALYLVHAVILPPMTLMIGSNFETGAIGCFVIASALTVLCIAAGHLVHRTVERPLLDLCRPERLTRLVIRPASAV